MPFDYYAEAKSNIKEIQMYSKHAEISTLSEPNQTQAFINITIENDEKDSKYCIRLDQEGFTIVGNEYDYIANIAPSETHTSPILFNHQSRGSLSEPTEKCKSIDRTSSLYFKSETFETIYAFFSHVDKTYQHRFSKMVEDRLFKEDLCD
ncbi:hypothetical protein A3Q56_06789 [Intoshia linei]|uniref:GSKIP domain-containing protein n=1 Tax=Intoshia linei TaxID=1819745 RepID=A0A177ATZ8_9BILA|nr:hypothetical protein A3Q56_06789 [Intoshia linei]